MKQTRKAESYDMTKKSDEQSELLKLLECEEPSLLIYINIYRNSETAI